MNSIPDTPSRDSNATDLYLGIDVGGTTIKYGVCKNNGEIVARSSCPTESLVQPENVIRWGLRFASESISEIGVQRRLVYFATTKQITYARACVLSYEYSTIYPRR